MRAGGLSRRSCVHAHASGPSGPFLPCSLLPWDRKPGPRPPWNAALPLRWDKVLATNGRTPQAPFLLFETQVSFQAF